MTDEYRKLREELLPVFRMAKERTQPLPYQPSTASPDHPHDGMSSPVTLQPPPEKTGLARKLSKKPLWLNSTPKTNSPTYAPNSLLHESRGPDNSLDPSAAAVAATSHLGASLTSSQPSNSPNLPSPTSPNNYHSQPSSISTRTYATSNSTPSTSRSQHSYEELPHTSYMSTTSTLVNDRSYDRSNPTPTPGRRDRAQNRNDQDESPRGGGDASSVEIYKSFRVSMEDPCYKVLPAALKKYNINADWRQYALYIVFGDQERCLGLEEKPLILFKQLDKEGKKPMFMLRRHAAPMEGHSGPTGMAGAYGGLGSGGGHQSAIQLPGGVL